jgi:WD40 repeat protein
MAESNEFLFEWELLRQLYDDSRRTILYKAPDDATDVPSFVEFSHDGHWIAVGQPGSRVAIYDTKQRRLRPLENEPPGGAADVAFSPGGNEVITVSPSGFLNRRNVITGKVVGRPIDCGIANEPLNLHNSIRVSPDGKFAALALGRGSLVIANLENGTCTRIAAHQGPILAFAFSPQGTTLVTSGRDHTVKTWDLSTYMPIWTLNCRSQSNDVQFTADGGRLVICEYMYGVRVFDPASRAELPSPRSEEDNVMKLATCGDQVLAAAGLDDRILLWDLVTGRRMATLVGHEGNVVDMDFSEEGKSLVSSSADGTVRLWPLGEVLQQKIHDDSATSQLFSIDLEFSADGKRLTSSARPQGRHEGSGQTSITQWNMITGARESFVSQGSHTRCDLAIVPKTENLLYGGPGEFAIKHRQSGELIRVLDDDPLHEYSHVVVSSDGKWAAGCGHVLDRPRPNEYFFTPAVGKVCFVAIYNLETDNRELQFFPITTDFDTWVIRAIEFSPDSKFLVAGGGDFGPFYRVDIFARRGDRFVKRDVHELKYVDLAYVVQEIGFSADSHLVGTITMSGLAKFWSLSGPVWNAEMRRTSGLWSLAFSPDGRLVALGDATGIQLYDLKSKFPLATIPVGNCIIALRFSPDGRTLAWASADGRVDLLRAASGESDN